MALSRLPLSYCTNVHPGRSAAEVLAGLDRYTTRVHRELKQPLAAGLWLAQPVVAEILSTADGIKRFAASVHERNLPCYTLNAFPFGDFHSPRVKEKVYLPDWSHPDRLEYTKDCARILAELLPKDVEGSISTVPLGFKGFSQPAGFRDACIVQLLALVTGLDEIRRDTGKLVRLAIEPEPLCLLETTDEAVAFFDTLFAGAERVGLGELTREHLGLCYDVCHQAVEFEDVATSIRAIDAAGVRINKVHVSCAIEIQHPGENPEALAALSRYVERRYLHQTTAQAPNGATLRYLDLDEALIRNPSPPFRDAASWRVHFHVPVDAERLGPLHTTRPDLITALRTVLALAYAPHLEVETYTWEVLPDQPGQPDLVAGLTAELQATGQLIAEL